MFVVLNVEDEFLVQDFLIMATVDGLLPEDMLLISKTGVALTTASADLAGPRGRIVKIVRQSFVENSLLYIRENFKDKLTLEGVASKVFVNPKYFSHVFKREMGVSFTEYVRSLRVEFACKLLATTNYHAYRISLECGFSDPSYFNRVFCSQMNMTPQTYRKYASYQRGGN